MSHFRPLVGTIVLCCLFAVLAGCSGGGARRYAVSGSVKWRDKPLDHGVITFQPEDVNLGSSAGSPIKDGRYAIPVAQGLLPGRYKVSISSADPSKTPDPDAQPGISGPLPKDRISAKYNVETTLTAEVKAGGQNTFDFKVD